MMLRNLEPPSSRLEIKVLFTGLSEVNSIRKPTQKNPIMQDKFFETETWLPMPRKAVFDFFSRAENLEKITPAWLQFKILTGLPIEMSRGTIIDYRIRLAGFPLVWKTLIADWQPPHRFADVQLQGPYKKWHHEHIFIEQDHGTLVKDRVTYRLPGGPFAGIVHSLAVGRSIEKIFIYREKALAQHFHTP